MGTLAGRATLDSPTMSRNTFVQELHGIGGEDAIPGGAQTHEIVSFIAPDEGQAMAGFMDLLRGLIEANPGKRILWRWRPQVGDRREGDKIMKVCSARFRFE